MTNTTYYNLNIVEGTDIVNPLTVDNPNYEKIDETMHDNAVSGVTLATEIANATVHAITRENSECAVIRFIATSVWKAGDTATVDGVPVTALLPSGETLPDGAYVINANVLCILTGTNMTVFAERKKTDNANDIKYNDTNVGSELDAVNRNLNNKILHLTFNTNGYELKGGSMYCVAWRSAVDQGLINACDRVYYLDDYIPRESGYDRNNSFMITACATSQSSWGSENVGYQKQFTSDVFIFKVNSNDANINMIITLCKK